MEKREKTDGRWFDIQYKRGSQNEELDREQASLMAHRVIVHSLPGIIELQLDFDDIEKVSKQTERDEFKLNIKRPEIFLPADVDFERIDLKILSNMKFYRSVPPQLSIDTASKIKVGAENMEKVVRSTQALNIAATIVD